MSTQKSPSEQVDAYIRNQESSMAKLIQAVRETILSAGPEIGEQIKWNSPCFYYTGEMKDFDPKTYKRDIAVVNIRKGFVMLVLPTGATIKDNSGLLEGDYTDGRRLINFRNMEDLISKKEALKNIMQQWLKLVEK